MRGDLFSLPFNGSIDIAYCAFLLPELVSHDDYDLQSRKADYQIARSLKRKGLGFLDEQLFSRPCFLNELVENLEHDFPDFSKGFDISNNPDIRSSGNYLKIRRNK